MNAIAGQPLDAAPDTRPGPPAFTMQEVRAALPAAWSQPSAALALKMIAKSTLFTGIGMIALAHAPAPLVPFVWLYLGFALYGFLAIGHECGHGAMFKRQWLNDALGSLCFLVGLMPYNNWMQAHQRHHANTNHYDLEEYFGVGRRPIRGGMVGFTRALLQWLPPVGLAFVHYLYMFGVRAKVGRLFRDNLYWNREYNSALSYLNLLSILVTIAGLVSAAVAFGAWPVVKFAIVPMLLAGAVSSMVGYMHHQDHDGTIVRFEDDAWGFVEGSMQTVDRTFGPLDILIHDAARQHVFHHLFPTLPHAYGWQVMPALAPIVGAHHRFDPKNAMLRWPEVFRNSQVMSGEGRMRFGPLPPRGQ